MPFVVKYIPTGEYITRCSNPLWEIECKTWGKKPLSNNINKARVYNQKSHVLSSLGSRPILGKETRTYKVCGGKEVTREVDILGEKRVNPNLFEVIEIGLEPK
jgi:hypothetical protein